MGYAAPIVSLIAGVYSSHEQRKAGVAQANQYKVEAKTEQVAAGQREIERRRNLIRALASQNAAAGAAGIETSGSAAAIYNSDINDAQNDLLYDTFNSKARQRALMARASNSVKAGNAAANASLLDTASSFYKTGM